MRHSAFSLPLLAVTLALATPGVDVSATNDTVLKVVYTGGTPNSTTHPAVTVQGKLMGIHATAENSSDARGVIGQVSSYTLPTIGRTGVMGAGVYGVVGSGTTGVHGMGTNTGVYAFSTNNVGLAAVGGTYGVTSAASSTNGVGVFSQATGTTSTGVFGEGTKYGVHGKSTASAATAIYAQATGYNSKGLHAVGVAYGVYAITTESEATGVYGESNNDGIGVYGVGAASSTGVVGQSSTGVGVTGSSANDLGVFAYGATYGIQAQGNIYAGYFNGDVYSTGSFIPFSDRALKQNIRPLNHGLNAIMALSPKAYEMKPGVTGGPTIKGTRLGLIAQEVQSVVPEVVQSVKTPPQRDAKGKPVSKGGQSEFLSVNYDGLIPVLINAIQEQQRQIDALKAQLNGR